MNIHSVRFRHLLHIMSEKALLRSENTLSLVGENKKQQQQQQQQQKTTTQYDYVYLLANSKCTCGKLRLQECGWTKT